MPFDLFISYAHRDNARGQVRELHDAISANFQKFAGRNLTVFFDEHDIPSMADWEKRIAQGLRESRLFLAVLSPNYFASAYCRREWEEYVRYEAMRQCLGEGVAPVYFIELPGLDGSGVEQSIAAAVDEMRKRQWCDLASQKPVKIVPWHDAGKRALEDVEVARRLEALKEQMAERLKRADRAQQSPTNLYRHNPQFVGRVRELTLLREALNERGSVGVVGHETQSAGATAVHGLGGMGKTELALAYAHAFAWDYPGGRWLARCEGLDNFDLVLRQLAEPLDIEFTEDEKKDAHRAGERILAELRRHDRSLLLLDNVTHAQLLGPDVLMRLPPQGHIHLLATTRLGPAQLAGSPHDHTFVAVDELPPEDALALIRAHQPDARFASSDDEPAARKLVKLLDGFTLAVETAAIYLGKHPAPSAINAYTERLARELLAESEASAAATEIAVRHKEKLLERTLAVTFETLWDEAMHILGVAALLPADQVALPWVRTVAAEKCSNLTPDRGIGADLMWETFETELRSLRLFQSGSDLRVVRMHRLVQELLEKQLGDTRHTLDKALVSHAQSRSKVLWRSWVLKENRWELAPLTAYAWQCIERPGVDGCVLANEVAIPLESLGNFKEAEKLMRRAVDKSREEFGEDHSDHSACLTNLAHLLHATNHLTEAEGLVRWALTIDERNFGQNHPTVASRLGNLAALLQTNRPEQAEPLIRHALEIEEKCFGPDHPSVAIRLNNLAGICRATNRLREAEPLLRRALAIDERNFGPSHPEVATDLNNLASILHTTNQLTESERVFRRALEIDCQIFGLDHPNVARDFNNLAMLLRDTNRISEAEPLLRKALRINERSFGSDHPLVAANLDNLSQLLRNTNQLAEAEPLHRQLLQMLVRFQQSTGDEHPKWMEAFWDYAVMLQKLGLDNSGIQQRMAAIKRGEDPVPLGPANAS
ncbi:MAG: tetratricopeptide repeat protein [Planctomycetaceae bacterium]|nr:tetratricopeptide repeat protein [Planctomycetaceae bacterium]